MSSSPYEAVIWGHLVAMLGNEYAAAGIMGWWLGESGLYPQRCEGDFVYSGGTYPKSDAITARINAGRGSEDGKIGFAGTGVPISDPRYMNTWWVNGNRYGPGYGLAQWTGEGRKGVMWDFWNTAQWDGVSISDPYFQCFYCVRDMRNNYGACYRAMISASSVEYAMYQFGYWYETGGNAAWTSSIVASRLAGGLEIYNRYTGTAPVNPDPEIPIDPDPEPPAWEGGEPLPAWILHKKEVNNPNVKRFYRTRNTRKL